MPREKLNSPVTLLTTIESAQHEALRLIAFNERRSIADLVREGINEILKKHAKSRKPVKMTVVAQEKTRASAQGR